MSDAAIAYDPTVADRLLQVKDRLQFEKALHRFLVDDHRYVQFLKLLSHHAGLECRISHASLTVSVFRLSKLSWVSYNNRFSTVSVPWRPVAGANAKHNPRPPMSLRVVPNRAHVVAVLNDEGQGLDFVQQIYACKPTTQKHLYWLGSYELVSLPGDLLDSLRL